MESEAELVCDKEASNFCDFFAFADSRIADLKTGRTSPEDRKKKARDAFDKLFGDS